MWLWRPRHQGTHPVIASEPQVFADLTGSYCMGDRTCYREYCPDCDAQVTIVDEECPDCGRRLQTE